MTYTAILNCTIYIFTVNLPRLYYHDYHDSAWGWCKT